MPTPFVYVEATDYTPEIGRRVLHDRCYRGLPQGWEPTDDPLWMRHSVTGKVRMIQSEEPVAENPFWFSPLFTPEYERELNQLRLYGSESSDRYARRPAANDGPITQAKIDRVFGQMDTGRRERLAQHAEALRDRLVKAGKSEEEIDAFVKGLRLE